MKNSCAWGICVAVLLVAVAMRTTAAEAQQGTPNFIAKFDAAGLPNANSIMFDNGKNVGIGTGTTPPGSRLHIHSPDNDALKVTNTAVGKTLRIGVDQLGAWLEPTEQNSSIRLNANPGRVGLFINGQTGNVGIGTGGGTDPTGNVKLDVAGNIRSRAGGFIFPDGTTQTTATLRGPQGQTGPAGPIGPPGPPTQSSAVCVDPIPPNNGVCSCEHLTVSNVSAPCSVTSQTGPCTAHIITRDGLTSRGACCVCGL